MNTTGSPTGFPPSPPGRTARLGDPGGRAPGWVPVLLGRIQPRSGRVQPL